MEASTQSIMKIARKAGWWYLLMAMTGPIGLLYVPATLIVPGDAAATVSNILASEFLFRIGIVSCLLCQIAFIFLVLELYRLFRDVDRKQALLMVALVLVSVPIAFVNMIYPLVVMFLLSGTGFLNAFEPAQLNALVMVFLKFQEYGTALAEVFWGLWLFPFGILAFKSGFFPKILGILLILAGSGYVIHSIFYFLFPHYEAVVATYAAVPEGLGELSMVLWLLIKGAKDNRTQGAI